MVSGRSGTALLMSLELRGIVSAGDEMLGLLHSSGVGWNYSREEFN